MITANFTNCNSALNSSQSYPFSRLLLPPLQGLPHLLSLAISITLASLTTSVSVTAQQPAADQQTIAGSLIIAKPWARATPAGAKVGAGYLTIINTGSTPDRLLSVTTKAADRTQIHTTTMLKGIIRMRHQKQGLELAPKSLVSLKPGSHHLMFIGLNKPLKKGVPVTATLNFAKAGIVDVIFRVTNIGGRSPYDSQPRTGGSSSGQIIDNGGSH